LDWNIQSLLPSYIVIAIGDGHTVRYPTRSFFFGDVFDLHHLLPWNQDAVITFFQECGGPCIYCGEAFES
jgi:hypothetical protein